MTREQKLALIWRHTHRDYRGVVQGQRSIMQMVPGQGTSLVMLDSLTDAQIAEHMPWALRQEAKRKLKNPCAPS